MPLTTKTLTQIVTEMVQTVQANCKTILNFSTGSIIRSFVEAVAGMILWVQALCSYVLALARATTSTGPDLDSWMADFNFKRLQAQPASGIVTFSRFTANVQSIIPITTTTVTTTDGSQVFFVIPDTNNSAYDPTQNAYVIPIGTSSITASVQASVAGSAGNVTANTVTLMQTAIQGVDTVNNGAPFTNGADKESDTAYRARFVLYLQSLSEATLSALEYAIEQAQPTAKYNIVENIDYATGDQRLGYFYAVVDDGSGDPPSGFINSIYRALDVARALTIVFEVQPPDVIDAAITLEVQIPAGAATTPVQTAVQNAIAQYVDSLNIGETLYFTRIAELAYDARTEVVNVTNVLINSATSDIVATSEQVVKAVPLPVVTVTNLSI
jgi:uncharacterized phage protein gp47/JayE